MRSVSCIRLRYTYTWLAPTFGTLANLVIAAVHAGLQVLQHALALPVCSLMTTQ